MIYWLSKRCLRIIYELENIVHTAICLPNWNVLAWKLSRRHQKLDPLFDHANTRAIGDFVPSKMALLREIVTDIGQNMTLSTVAEWLRQMNT